jgi:hypothetical protein
MSTHKGTRTIVISRGLLSLLLLSRLSSSLEELLFLLDLAGYLVELAEYLLFLPEQFAEPFNPVHGYLLGLWTGRQRLATDYATPSLRWLPFGRRDVGSSIVLVVQHEFMVPKNTSLPRRK